MEWIVAIIFMCVAIPLMVVAMSALKKSGRGKSRFGGAALAFGLAFGAIFDPAKKAAIENIQKNKDIGDADLGESGELID